MQEQIQQMTNEKAKDASKVNNGSEEERVLVDTPIKENCTDKAVEEEVTLVSKMDTDASEFVFSIAESQL